MSSPLTPPSKSLPSSSTTNTESISSELPIASTSTTIESLPLPPLFLAAQTGDLNLLASLLSSSEPTTSSSEEEETIRANVNDKDSQGITALHWAAINNHLLACKYLLEQGAEVDAIGGDLSATPMHWAARNGHLYIVHLLLKYNADPTLLDSQSFNTLHLAVHSSSALLLAYLLFTSQPVAIDSSDLEGHTSLHWACYQGDSISVDLLLRSGADPRRADNAGLVPLHWAAVKGNAACIKRLIEAGAELGTKEKLGKTPRDMAVELKSLPAFQRGLSDAGCGEDGRKLEGVLSARHTILAILGIPTVVFFIVLITLSYLPWWSAILFMLAEFFGMHHLIAKVLLDVKGKENSDRITKSPYFTSIIIASLIWVTYVWITRCLFGTTGYRFSNLICGTLIVACSYNFYRAITLDPGHVPPPANENEMKESIETLVESGAFNGTNFCLTCMSRRPLRSKHSFATGKCTAKFDHYCPWVWNDVGVNNHRQFLLFVITLVLGVSMFIRLLVAYYSQNAPTLPTDETCILPTTLCTASHFDTFALTVGIWAGLQLTWTLILLSAQLWQVTKQMTTLEVSNVGRYGYMGGKPSTSPLTGAGSQEVQSDHAHGPNCDHSKKGAGKKGGKANFLLKILGIDRFTNGKAAEGIVKSSSIVNPFDLGVIRNCNDFWTAGKELGVDYTRIYEVPSGGFERSVKERRRRENGGEEGSGIGYERVAMNEV